MNLRLSSKNCFSCPECHVVQELDDSIFETYFKEKNWKCPNCGKNLSDILLANLNRTHVTFGLHYGLLGCINEILEINLQPNEFFDLDLNNKIKYGELLYINVSGVGKNPVRPMVSTNLLSGNYNYKRVVIYGKPNNPKKPSEGYIQVMYWYAPEEIKNDLSNMLLLDAFKFFFEGNYRYMIISANSAVEILLSKFLNKIIDEKEILSKSKKDDFLKKNMIDYRDRLDILLPLFSKILGFPELNDPIYEGLKNLNSDRNKLIHSGETPLETKRLKRELISAFLAFKYFKIIHKVE